MIKELIGKALQGEGSDILKDLDLSGDKKDKALNLAKDSVLGGLTDAVSAGNISEVTQAFSGGGSNSLVQGVIVSYGSKLVSKLGVSESIASTISEKIIPMVFNFIGKSDDAPTDSDDGVKDMLGDLVSDGIKGKLGGMMKNLF